MQQQTVRLRFPGRIDLRAQAHDSLQAAQGVDAHAEVDDDEIGIRGQVNSAAFDGHPFLRIGLYELDEVAESIV